MPRHMCPRCKQPSNMIWDGKKWICPNPDCSYKGVDQLAQHEPDNQGQPNA